MPLTLSWRKPVVQSRVPHSWERSGELRNEISELCERLQDHTNWYHNSRQQIISTLAAMPLYQQYAIAARPHICGQIAAALDRALGHNKPARQAAQLLLDSIAAGRTVHKDDIFARLCMHATAMFTNDSDVVEDVTEAFQHDSDLRDTIVHPVTAAEESVSAAFANLLRLSMSARAFEQSGMKLLAQGYVPLCDRVLLDDAFVPNKERIIREILNATEEEKKALLQDDEEGQMLRSHTLDWLNDKQKEYVLQSIGTTSADGVKLLSVI